MNADKVAAAIEKLEDNLPIRTNQLALDPGLRELHQRILQHYLRHGYGPAINSDGFRNDSADGFAELARQKIIIINAVGDVVGAYPFVTESRRHQVLTSYGQVSAMCAFDALAISSMFDVETEIHSSCQVSNVPVLIRQMGNSITVGSPDDELVAAVNWKAMSRSQSCSDSLCLEMMFIAGRDRASKWVNDEAPGRELFSLQQAHTVISEIFVPLMH